MINIEQIVPAVAYVSVALVAGTVATVAARLGRAGDTVAPRAPSVGLLMFAVIAVLILPDLLAASFAGARQPKSELSPVVFARLLGVKTLLAPLMALALVAVLRAAEAIQPAELGISGMSWGADVWTGYRAWLIITPLLFLLNLLVMSWNRMSSEPHPILRMLAEPGADRMLLWTVATVYVTFAAPLTEELLFRGLIQPWFRQTPNSAPAGLILAGGLGALVRMAKGGDALTAMLSPLALALMIGLMYPMVHKLARQPDAVRGIYVSAALFALVHSQAWPNPIALVPLALMLGYLRETTGRLTASLVLHGLFNLTTMIDVFVRMQ